MFLKQNIPKGDGHWCHRRNNFPPKRNVRFLKRSTSSPKYNIYFPKQNTVFSWRSVIYGNGKNIFRCGTYFNAETREFHKFLDIWLDLMWQICGKSSSIRNCPILLNLRVELWGNICRQKKIQVQRNCSLLRGNAWAYSNSTANAKKHYRAGNT